MSDTKAVPGTRDLEGLWHALEDQLRESGRVARFTADVHDGDDVDKLEVIRAGEFATVKDNGRFLIYEPKLGLVEAAHQPAWHMRHVAANFADETAGLVTMVIDPGAGSVLRQIAGRPDVFGRIVKTLLLFVLLMLTVPQLRRLWQERKGLRVASGDALADALAVYDSRFNVALFVSLWHLAFLLWLLQGLFGADSAKAEIATAQEVFQIVPIDAPPAANVQEAAASGPPSPPPPIPAPTLSVAPPTSTVKAPVEVAMPSINVPMPVQSGGALFGSQFAGFAGSAGNGNGAGGAGSGTGGGGTGRGVGGGGKPIIPLSTARPQISDYAFQRGIEGWVVVSFTVGTEGRVKNIRIVDADPKGVFEAAAVESIANWIYPRLGFEAQLTQRVEFKLEDHQYNWNR
jgi:protein TonB